MAVAALPELTEVKHTLTGGKKVFRCQTVARAPGAVVVLFVSPAALQVHGLALPAGTVTFGYFWEARPYNVYHWMDPAGSTLAHYVNLADHTAIAPDDDDGTLTWRDLAVDVMLAPGAPPAVLDEDEVPADLDPDTRAHLAAALDAVLASADTLRAELEAASTAHWPRVFATERRP